MEGECKADLLWDKECAMVAVLLSSAVPNCIVDVSGLYYLPIIVVYL